MDIAQEVREVVGKPESSMLEYKAVLPPSSVIAQIVSSMASTDGGYIILGVRDDGRNNVEVVGLSGDFQAIPIVSKALRMLTPEVQAYYQYVDIDGKKVFAIKIEKMPTVVTLQGKIYERVGNSTHPQHSTEIPCFIGNGNLRLRTVSQQLVLFRVKATDSMTRLVAHYQGILKIIDETATLLSATGPNERPSREEGKILSRVIYSSFVDNFETFLSDLLFEIFLAKPETLKSGEKVTLEEVLNCADLQEFVEYWSKHKVSKLQRGSVKGFIRENKQIRDLGIMDEAMETKIEKILQVRHLYSHRNGIVDEKFQRYFGDEFPLGSLHETSVSQSVDTLAFLATISKDLDSAAITKYDLNPLK